jgi:LacI family transcriptional regulator
MANDKSKKPKLEDVAAHAGVSVATVSRVINQSNPVSQNLEMRVKQAMETLGFEPKRSKARTRPITIAFVLPELINPASTAVVAGVQEEADKTGLCLVVLQATEKPGHQPHNLKLLDHLPFDGLILFHSHITSDEILKLYNRRKMPIVVLGRVLDSPYVYCINTDREGGMYQATKYLLSLNHRQIAYLSGPPDWELSKVRLRGVQRALAEANLTLDPALYRWCFPNIDWGFQVASSLFQRSAAKRPTAILAFNDLIAIGALHAIRTFGLTVPDDISVVGFDNIYLTAHTNPPLTTVSQPNHQVGQLALQKIYSSLDGYDTNQGGFTLLECPLVVRESTGPCPANATLS